LAKLSDELARRHDLDLLGRRIVMPGIEGEEMMASAAKSSYQDRQILPISLSSERFQRGWALPTCPA